MSEAKPIFSDQPETGSESSKIVQGFLAGSDFLKKKDLDAFESRHLRDYHAPKNISGWIALALVFLTSVAAWFVVTAVNSHFDSRIEKFLNRTQVVCEDASCSAKKFTLIIQQTN